MSDKAQADKKGAPPADDSLDHESWLREAAHAPQPVRLPRPGDLVGGKYRVEDLLGRGGMGVVFRARHVVSEKPVAIKWMLRSTTDEQARRRFEREARAAGRIDHPNVVTLYDVGDDGDTSYMVMELLRGESLRKRLSRGPLLPAEAVDTLLPALRGVAAAHRAGVVHRDLKPDNIFLCQDVESGQVTAKVLDFGVSSIAALETADSTLTQEGALLGSLAYMSPEQLRSPHDVDARTDVYAFGVIFYELLTGVLPFTGASHSALIVAIATTQPKPLSQLVANVPSGLEAVVNKCLSRDGEARFPGMNSLIDALSPFASTPRVSGGFAASPAAAAPPARAAAPSTGTVSGEHRSHPHASVHDLSGAGRRRGAAGAVVAGIVVLFASIALWVLFGDRAEPATPAAVPPSPKVEAAAAPALVAEPAPAPATAAPPAAPSVRESSSPAPSTAQRPARPRGARAKATRGEGAPGEAAIQASEKDLFSGRK